MKGKSKCKILKEIRKQIAKDNNIDFVTSECKYQGNCSGTCPKCEEELRYLESELQKKQAAGKAVAVAGIAAALLVSTAGCQSSQNAGRMDPESETSQQQELQGTPTTPTLMGEPTIDPTYYPTEPSESELMGMMIAPTDPTY